MSPESQHILDTLAPDEPVFILRGQDYLAPYAVHQWIEAAKRNGVRDEKIEAASRHLRAIEDWQQGPHHCKMPD